VARRERNPIDPDVPRLPRGKGFKMSFGEIVRIGLTATMLIAVLVLAQPCAEAVGRFVANFDPPDAQLARPPQPTGYVHLNSDMTPQQIEQAIAGARDAGAGASDAGVRDAMPDASARPQDGMR
jgi:hypothetical protein